MKPKYVLQSISFLFLITLCLLLSWGCTTLYQQSSILTQQRPYQIPDVQKSELATIHIDTNWIQHNSRFFLLINDQIAARENFSDTQKYSMNDVLIVPGTHDMAVLLTTEAKSKETKSVMCLSIEVKADTTYLLTAEYVNDIDDELCFQLINTRTQEVVSYPKTDANTTFNYKDFNNGSVHIGGSFHF